MVLTSLLMNILQRMVLVHLYLFVSFFMDLLHFAYEPLTGEDDTVIYLL